MTSKDGKDATLDREVRGSPSEEVIIELKWRGRASQGRQVQQVQRP